MGICGRDASEAVDPSVRRSSRLVDKAMMSGIEENAKRKTLILLGAGESGKSTVFKQVQVIHSGGYTPEQMLQFRYIIQRNALDGITILLNEAQKRDLELTADNEDVADQILLWGGENLNPEIGAVIARVWKDQAIQDCYKRRAEFQLGDSVVYFLNKVEQLSALEYLPTMDDVLRARVRTSGVVSKDFCIQKAPYRMYDVGGQRSERRRWMQFFDHVTAIVFVAAISEYDQVMAEDSSKNRMEEALDLFEQIVNSHYFTDIDVMLFLNKRDLFAEKIQHVDPVQWFPDYKGGKSFDAAELYFKDQFRKRVHDPKKEVYMYTTCATDTGNIQFVFDAIQSMLLQNELKDGGF